MSKELEALKIVKSGGIGYTIDEYGEAVDIVETALKEYELMKQVKIIVDDKKITDDYLEKLKNQRVFVGSLEQCEIKPLFDEETQKKLKALEIIKEKMYSWSKLYINTDDQRVSNVLTIYDIDDKEKKLVKEGLL